MSEEMTPEERHAEWCDTVDNHLDQLGDDVDSLRVEVQEIGVVKRLLGGFLVPAVIGALGFGVTAYVAFDRLGRAQDDLAAHREAPALRAHPDLGETLDPVRSTQDRILATVESMQRDSARRDAEIQARLDRLEDRIDAVRGR